MSRKLLKRRELKKKKRKRRQMKRPERRLKIPNFPQRKGPKLRIKRKQRPSKIKEMISIRQGNSNKPSNSIKKLLTVIHLMSPTTQIKLLFISK
jgi:hypothetical protein